MLPFVDIFLIIILGFPIWALIDCLKRPYGKFPTPGPRARLFWALSILFLWTLGAAIYYLVVYYRMKKPSSDITLYSR